MAETARRREKQAAYNAEHGITPATIKRDVTDIVGHLASKDQVTIDTGIEDRPHMVGHNLRGYIEELEGRMRKAAADLEFEEAGRLRDEIRSLELEELGMPAEPSRAPVRGNAVSGKPGTRTTRYGKAKAARAEKRARGRA